MNIEEKIIKIITEQLGMRDGDVNADSTHESLGMDSLDDIEVIMAIEEAFGLEVDDRELEKLLSVQAVTRYVTNALNA
ncbi:acyl carrier protein [Marinobacterium sp. MBR-111]|jgi:acyl carrier protein|uniref:phosphopantetheine-binding protein n=1 Tax=Marinobacterium sp. MBR-111 TaxID=3156463 RepID=UPI0033920012